MSEPFILAGQEVLPGTSTIIDVPLPDLYTHSSLSMPVQVIRGKRQGPILFVSAAVHGDEINGVEIIRRLVKSKSLSRMKGTLITVPIVNVYGFLNQSRYLPDRRDLNRCFPGSVKGSLAARLAKLFMTEVAQQCTHGIDLHTAAIHRDNLPQIRADLSNPVTEQMALAFNAPVVVNSGLIEGSLRYACSIEKNLPVIVYEAGEALRFDEFSIRAGVKGILAVMQSIDMLTAPKRKTKKKAPEPFVAQSTLWVRAPQSGIFRMTVSMGKHVFEGDLLGAVATPYGEDGKETDIISPISGIIIGRTNLPLVSEGEALFHIARFTRPKDVVDNLEAFQLDLDPASDEAPPDDLPII